MNTDEIRKWHHVFKRPGELFEIRLLGDRTWSGYFYDVEDAIEQLQPYDNLNIYFTVNEVKSACDSRSQFDCFRQVKGTATSKQDIEHRWWLPIDVDCERPSGVSSTDAEKQLAHAKAGDVFRFLKANNFPEPVVCDSSSGYHIYLPIDIGNTPEAEAAVKLFLETLGNIFTDEHVKIDNVLFDANRIIRLPGTYGRKGRSTEDRPHRLAKILSVPTEIVRADLAALDAFNSRYKITAEPVKHQSYGGGTFDIRTFIRDHGIGVDKEIPLVGGGTKFILSECIFDSGHKAPDAAIFEMPNGAIAYKCFHQSCSSYSWQDVRRRFEPDAYNREYREIRPRNPLSQPFSPQPKQPTTPPVIEAESEEKGPIWLSMSDIQKVDIESMEHVKTGYTELDEKIKGLFMGEVTLISGNNSSGKSTFLNNLILNIIDQGWKVALWSGELLDIKLKRWLTMLAAGRKHTFTSPKGYNYVPDDLAKVIDEWLNGKLFIYNNKYGNRWEQVLTQLNKLVEQGVRIFFLDNLMAMNINIFEGDKNERQKLFVSQLTDFAKDNNASIGLVAHPRKASTLIRKVDISGTSDITNLIDNLFLIHRNNEDFKREGKEYFGAPLMGYIASKNYGNILEVAKNRLEGVQDLLVGMYYEPVSHRMMNAPDEEKEYGCFRTGEQTSMFTETAEQQPPQAFDPFSAPQSTEDCPF